jgi:Xaa-Pro aminopeptidase
MNKRVTNLRKLFDKNAIDGIFITQAENRRYLSGFHGTAGYLFITQDKAVLATDFRYTEQASSEAPDFEILRIGGKLDAWFPELVSDYSVKRLGFEAADVNFEFYGRIITAFKEKGVSLELVPLSGTVETLRTVKEPEEIKLIRQACVIGDRAFEKVIIKAGLTELQAAWELEKRMRENGSESLPFEIIIASGPGASLPHHKPSGRAIVEGEPVVIDMGAKVAGYASDLTRTMCAGRPDARFKEIYDIVFQAQQAAMTQICEGMTGERADNIAREIIKQAGYGDHFGHSLGHGVGLAEHESPRLGPCSQDILGNGMVFSIEPGIYLPGWGGIRIEDTVVMERGNVTPLTMAKKIHF